MMRPCERIPVEIWQDIFLLLAKAESILEFDELACEIWGRKPQVSFTRGPMVLPQTPSLLGQVCSQWRELAHGMPDLWNVLFVKSPRYTSEYNSSQYAGITELVGSRLSLARSMPLKICMDAKDDTEFARLIIPALIPFSRQWEALHLYAPLSAFADLDNLRASNIPRLATLKTVSQMYAPGMAASLPKPTYVPLMDRISTIQRLCTSFLPPPTSSVYGALEELHIQQMRSEMWSIVSVLASCPRLKVLTLNGFGLTMLNTHSPLTPQPALTIPSLETLNLEHPVGKETLLDLLVLPNLKTIFLGGKCNGESTQSILNCINRLKERSDVESLERLSLSFEMHSMDSSSLIDLLRANPLLKRLRIDDSYRFMNHPLVTSSLFDALTESNFSHHGSNHKDEALLCPQLEALKLTGCSDFEDAKLLTFLKNRCRLKYPQYEEDGSLNGRPAATITQVDISIKRKADAELLETIHHWQQMGFLMRLGSRS